MTEKQIAENVKQKMPGVNAASIETAIKPMKGTARSIKIEVVA